MKNFRTIMIAISILCLLVMSISVMITIGYIIYGDDDTKAKIENKIVEKSYIVLKPMFKLKDQDIEILIPDNFSKNNINISSILSNENKEIILKINKIAINVEPQIDIKSNQDTFYISFYYMNTTNMNYIKIKKLTENKRELEDVITIVEKMNEFYINKPESLLTENNIKEYDKEINILLRKYIEKIESKEKEEIKRKEEILKALKEVGK